MKEKYRLWGVKISRRGRGVGRGVTMRGGFFVIDRAHTIFSSMTAWSLSTAAKRQNPPLGSFGRLTFIARTHPIIIQHISPVSGFLSSRTDWQHDVVAVDFFPPRTARCATV